MQTGRQMDSADYMNLSIWLKTCWKSRTNTHYVNKRVPRGRIAKYSPKYGKFRITQIVLST